VSDMGREFLQMITYWEESNPCAMNFLNEEGGEPIPNRSS
jgi:hypothetical protein